MRPGISIQHASLPQRTQGVVRCDIGAVIGFIPRESWPEEATAGDFLEFRLRRWQELEDHPQRGLVDAPSRRAVRAFFENGGDDCFVFTVCIRDEAELRAPGLGQGVLAPLLDRLAGEDEIALLCVPAAAWMRCEISRNGAVRSDAEALYNELLAHCRQMNNRFLILDSPRGLHGDLLTRWFEAFRAREPLDRCFGAVYYPWICRGDDLYPPSGAVMGVFARTELEHAPYGVSWPPANAAIHGATHTEIEMDWGEAGSISDIGINPLVTQPGRGVVVWGARTMSLDPAWTFVNSRRIVSMISEQLRRDNEWAVFETNDTGLWRVLERDVMVRLDQFWSAGLLGGTRAQEEYSVECNGATNPVEARNAGQLNVLILLKPVSTTERILIDLRLGASGA